MRILLHQPEHVRCQRRDIHQVDDLEEYAVMDDTPVADVCKRVPKVNPRPSPFPAQLQELCVDCGREGEEPWCLRRERLVRGLGGGVLEDFCTLFGGEDIITGGEGDEG